MRALLALGTICLLASHVALSEPAPQPHAAHRSATLRLPRELVERPTSIRQAIGNVHDPVTTSSPHAQRFYDQGVAHLHSFAWIDAARSFHQALRLDPRLAMAHVGLSYAFSGLNASVEARAALEKAVTLGSFATARERLRIDIRVKELQAEDGSRRAPMRTAY